jgi:plasmid stabilization system protein ParE
MGFKLIVSKEAHMDIEGIVHYIAVMLGNPSAAAGFLDDVDRSYCAVIDNPYMYNFCNNVRLKKEGYRKIIIKNYLILYRIDDEKRMFL